MTGGSRGFHHKSRNGCSRCKQRRVKCNFQAPSCSNCTRRGEICDYRFLGVNKSPAWSSASEHSAASSHSQGSSSPEGLPATLNLPEFHQDTRFLLGPLFHIFSPMSTEPTEPTPRSVPEGLPLCLLHEEEAHLIPEEMADQTDADEFLRHNLTAISTLHGKHVHNTSYQLGSKEDKDADVIAYEHQITASNLFCHSVGSVNDRNWFIILVFAVSVLIFHFDTTRRADHLGGEEEFLEPILALRGAARLGMELGPWLMKSKLLAAMRSRLAAQPPEWDHLAEQAISDLHLVNKLSPSSSLQARTVCQDAIHKLQFWLKLSSSRPQTWLHFVWWPGAVDAEFLELVHRREPVALLILIHWCAVMKSAPRRWFMEGWAEKIAQPAALQLGGDWNNCMQWASSKLTIDALS